MNIKIHHGWRPSCDKAFGMCGRLVVGGVYESYAGVRCGSIAAPLAPFVCWLWEGKKAKETTAGPEVWTKEKEAHFFFGGGGLQLNVSGLVFRICLCHEVLGTFGDHSEVWDVDLGDRIEHIVGSRLEDDIHMRTPSPVIVALHHVAASLRLGLCLSVPDRLRRVSVAFPASETQLPAT